MSKARIIQLLDSLKTEIENTTLDQKSLSQLQALEKEVRSGLERSSDGRADDTILDSIKRLEIDFAQKHPTIEGIVREIVDSLGKMGI